MTTQLGRGACDTHKLTHKHTRRAGGREQGKSSCVDTTERHPHQDERKTRGRRGGGNRRGRERRESMRKEGKERKREWNRREAEKCRRKPGTDDPG